MRSTSTSESLRCTRSPVQAVHMAGEVPWESAALGLRFWKNPRCPNRLRPQHASTLTPREMGLKTLPNSEFLESPHLGNGLCRIPGLLDKCEAQLVTAYGSHGICGNTCNGASLASLPDSCHLEIEFFQGKLMLTSVAFLVLHICTTLCELLFSQSFPPGCSHSGLQEHPTQAFNISIPGKSLLSLIFFPDDNGEKCKPRRWAPLCLNYSRRA